MTLNEDKHSLPAERQGKHTALIRPAYGNFGRNEWAILGASCGVIKALATQVIATFSTIAKIAYIDAQHSDEPETLPDRIAAGAHLEYTQHQGHQHLTYNGELNNFQNRALLNSADMILINGNHHQGQKQVVIIDSRKEVSLQKRLSQLTDVRLILLADGETESFEFLTEAIPNLSDIPVYRLDETEKIIAFFKDQITVPELYALVLAGGKSARMGEDKGTINWHGKDQRYHMADLLKNYTDQIYISCRADQQGEINTQYQTLPDTFTGLGPFGAILSAFREQPEKAWLVVACDLPLLDKETLDFLTANRAPSSIATAFQSTFNDFPEPLITIWEPKSYAVLLSFLAQGYSCPRKVLINSDVKILHAPNTDALTNVNTPDERERVQATIDQKNIPA